MSEFSGWLDRLCAEVRLVESPDRQASAVAGGQFLCHPKAMRTHGDLRGPRILHELAHYVLAPKPAERNFGLPVNRPYSTIHLQLEAKVLCLQDHLQRLLGHPLDLDKCVPQNQVLLRRAMEAEGRPGSEKVLWDLWWDQARASRELSLYGRPESFAQEVTVRVRG